MIWKSPKEIVNLDTIRECAYKIKRKVKDRRERLFGEFRKKIENLVKAWIFTLFNCLNKKIE